MEDLRTQSGELARELFGERDAIVSGALAIDAARAREKLRKFRLPDPHLYVVQFVRAASVLGATKVEFEITTSEAECRFDSTVNSELLADIWSVAFRERRSRQEVGANHLALGIGSAQGLNPERIVVESGAAVLTLREESDHFSEENDPVDGTRIFLREKFRLGHLVEFFTTLWGTPTEVFALRRYCPFASLEVTINGESIAVRGSGAFGRPMGLDVAPPNLPFDDGTENGVVKLVGEAGPTRFALVKDDVVVGPADVTPHGATAHGVVYSPRIRTDISGLSLVRDAVVEDIVLGAPMDAYHRALLAWAREDAGLSARRRLAAKVFEFHHVLARAGVPPADGSNALREWLESQELFHNANWAGGALTPREIVVGDRIRCSSRYFSESEFESDGPVVFQRGSAGIGALEAWALYAGAELEDLTERIESARMGVRRKAIWENQLPIPPPDFPFQERVEVDGARAFVYLPLRSLTGSLRSPTGLRLSVGDKPVAHFPWDLPIGIDLRGRLQPTEAYDGFVVDDTMKRLLAAVIRATPGVFEAYAEALLVADAVQPQRPRLTDAWIATLIESDFPERVLTLALSEGAVRPLLASHVVCEVTGAGVVLQREHPLADFVAKRPDDDGAVAFLASVVYSEVNRYYETITDPDEVGFQSRFLASRIPRSDG